MHRKNNGQIINAVIVAKHVTTWAMLLALTGALGALLFSLTPQTANASTRLVSNCQPYSFAIKGEDTCLPANRANTVWRWTGAVAADRGYSFIRYCTVMGAHEQKWGHAYRCVHLDDAGIWELTAGHHAVRPATPRPCKTPAGYLPSGDAGRFRVQEYVCTDGIWVHVTRYGNP